MTRKLVNRKYSGTAAEGTSGQELEARLGAVIGVAGEFARFDEVEQRAEAIVVQLCYLRIDLDIELAQAGDQVRAPGLVRDDDMARLADGSGIDVLVTARILLDR